MTFWSASRPLQSRHQRLSEATHSDVYLRSTRAVRAGYYKDTPQVRHDWHVVSPYNNCDSHTSQTVGPGWKAWQIFYVIKNRLNSGITPPTPINLSNVGKCYQKQMYSNISLSLSYWGSCPGRDLRTLVEQLSRRMRSTNL